MQKRNLQRFIFKGIGIALFLAFITGCVSTSIKPFTTKSDLASLEKDEKIIWEKAKELQSKLYKKSATFRDHEHVVTCLNNISQKVNKSSIDNGLTIDIYLLNDPIPNAYCLPNGAVFVTVGLLSILDSEDQMAMVLAHECSHFRNRHHLREMREAQNNVVAGMIVGLAVAIAAGEATGTTNTGGIAQSVSDLWVVSSMSDFSQDLEMEADQDAIRAVIHAGYRPDEAIQSLEHLRLYYQKYEPSQPKSGFPTHPEVPQRILYCTQIAEKEGVTPTVPDDKNTDGLFNEDILSAILENTRLNIKSKRYNIAEDNLTRCALINSINPQIQYLYGEMYRQQTYPKKDMAKSLEYYQKAIDLDSQFADGYREIGLIYRYENNPAKSMPYLTKYIELAPGNPDIPLIQSYLNENQTKEPQ